MEDNKQDIEAINTNEEVGVGGESSAKEENEEVRVVIATQTSDLVEQSERTKRIIRRTVVAFFVVAFVAGGITGLLIGLNPGKLAKYPNCQAIRHSEEGFEKLGDGRCDSHPFRSSYDLNTEECGWDDGDCDLFNEKYKNCRPGKHPSELEDFGLYKSYCEYKPETCKNYCNQIYNTEACGYDDGNCIELNEKYPQCQVTYLPELGNGHCRYGTFPRVNTVECGWDGGDCLHKKYPLCTGIHPRSLDDNQCEEYLNNEECGYDNGACDWYNNDYPNCTVEYPYYLQDNQCHNFGGYNSEECGWDGGACIEYNEKYPDCTAKWMDDLGDGECFNIPEYNNEACGWDGGDCLSFNAKYPNCTVANPSSLGDGYCHNDDERNTPECGYDGGDCLDFNNNRV